LRVERDRRARFTTIVWEWFDLVNSLAELRQNLDQQLAEAPPAVRTETIARWNALDGERTVSETALGKALQERSRVAAIQAKGEITIQRRSYDELMEDLDLRLNQESEEREWRTRAKDPGIAAALVRLDAAKAALLKARGEQRMRERSAAQAQLDRELAEVAAEEAWSTAERGRTESEHLREALEQRRQQVRDALENPEPKPEGDTKF
jgi:hypothetical protein